MDRDWETVLRKFQTEDDSDDDVPDDDDDEKQPEGEQSDQKDKEKGDDNQNNPNSRQNTFGLTKGQDFEFKVAFDIVSGGKDAIPPSKVYEVFLTLGFTFQSKDIATMLDNCIADRHGNYTADTLLEAFDHWKKSQFRVDDFVAVFNMIAKEGKLYKSFPTKYLGEDTKISIHHKAWKYILRDILHDDNLDIVGPDDAAAFAELISSQSDKSVNFEDFLRLFQT